MKAESVLVVDDNPDELMIIGRILAKRFPDLNVVTANDGEKALELLCNENRPKYMLALVLLDIKMPGMNGIETLHHIRQNPSCRYLPVVMLTSSNLKSDMEASYKESANSFVQKSTDYQEYANELTAIVNYWMKINKVP